MPFGTRSSGRAGKARNSYKLLALSQGEELFPTLCHPDDQSRIALYLEIIRQLSDGKVAQMEYRMKHRQGGWVRLLAF